MQESIWFIIIAYNPTDDLYKLVQSISGPCVVVDNSDKEKKCDQKQLRRTIYLRQEKNIGFAGGANVGIQYALEHGVEWVVIVNQDLSCSQRSITQFAESLSTKNSGVVGPFVGSLDPVRWSTILAPPRNPQSNMVYVSGSCMAIHKTVIDHIGYFYEPYFMYYEDVDFCVRAMQQKFPITPVSLNGVAHRESTSLGRGSVAHEYYLARNHLLFVERLAPWRVKVHEWVRIPKTLTEYQRQYNVGAYVGIKDYVKRSFGQLTGFDSVMRPIKQKSIV